MHIAVLSEQLGYPASHEEMERRLKKIEHDTNHALFVAEAGGRVIGWIHVLICPIVIFDLEVEVGGLVVDEEYRRSGAGRLLMERAEQWACEKGCRAVYLRSNIIRQDARPFYERIGYTVIKTRLAFRKVL
ncbi:MAG: GNAT family N-acetyltransferase [Bacteroidota bacterium]